MFLTPQKKSISSSNAGGVGGGEKYCARGIFFKFVRDAYGLYGGDHFSMKAAGHEIKSMNALLQCNIPQLHLPMVPSTFFVCRVACRVYCVFVVCRVGRCLSVANDDR
jgi:hypothetical protein